MSTHKPPHPVFLLSIRSWLSALLSFSTLQRLGTSLYRLIRHTHRFLLYFARRCIQDRINVTAGHLTYVSMLSIVPLLTVVFAMFSAFPMFETLHTKIQQTLLDNLIPTSSELISQHLDTFIANASQMTTIGIVFLFFVALSLMSTIDKTMNTIWRVETSRRLVVSFAIYWMILTLGPILIGASIAVSSYLLRLELLGLTSDIQHYTLIVTPLVSSWVAFLLLYTLVPNREIQLRYTVWGALLAATLFETAKYLFKTYLTYFPSYEFIYGALATIPILILWIYLSWNLILIGAEFSASLEEYRQKDCT